MFYAKNSKIAVFSILLAVFMLQTGVFAQEKKPENNSQKLVYTPKQDAMRIKANDVRITQAYDEKGELTGYHLYVRKIKFLILHLIVLLRKTSRKAADR